MSLIKKFQTKTARVKGVCFHPTRPWVITSLHSGVIQIWDYNMNIAIAKFQESQGPIRCVDFHPHLPLFVSGSDSGNVRVWNYKQKRCQFVLKGHIDYVRTAFFHHQLPWILTASDDQTMRIWNYQSRNCVNIITGHSHYVMCAQFHPQKNYIVSASLDSTVRIWDYTILRKKLTQMKNLSGFIGIQIQCIKILEGHEKGCNWVCFHPTSNLIASGSDDKKIKLWKYTNEVAWEHSTILGHKNNVSSLIFDPVTHNLITNSQDRTLRIWNIESKSQIKTQTKPKSRYWILGINKSGTLLASGHDEGLDMFQLNKQRVPHTLLSSDLVIFAHGHKTYLYDVKSKDQKMQLYQYKQKSQNSVSFIEKIHANLFQKSVFMVQIYETGQNEKFFMIKKKQAYLNFPIVFKQYPALDSCFVNENTIGALVSEKKIQLIKFTGKQDIKQIVFKAQKFSVKRIFISDKKNQLVMVTGHNSAICKFDTENKKIISYCSLEDTDVRAVIFSKDKIAILNNDCITITNSNFEKITVIKQKFPIKSIFWESEKLIFYTTIIHLKYAFMNGQTGVLKTIDQPFHLLQKLQGNKFLVFNKNKKVFEYQFPDYTEIQFRMAVCQKKIDQIKILLSKIKDSKKKILIKHLVENGYADLGLTLVSQLQEKFSLAIQSSNFELAFQICNKVNTQQYWKMLGQQALKQGIYEAYELSCQKLKNFDQLNFLYSLQNNEEKLQKMLKIAKKTNNLTLAFNANLFLNNPQTYEEVLRESGLESIAELSRQAYNDQEQKGQLLKRLKSKPLNPIKPVGQDNFANWPHNIEELQEQN